MKICFAKMIDIGDKVGNWVFEYVTEAYFLNVRKVNS